MPDRNVGLQDKLLELARQQLAQKELGAQLCCECKRVAQRIQRTRRALLLLSQPLANRRSLLDDGAIQFADLSPAAVEVISAGSEGVFGGGLFVNLDAPTGSLVDIEIAVLDLWAAVEDLAGGGVEGGVLLDAEVGADDVEGYLGHVADGRDVAWSVPGGADVELFGEHGDLATRGEAADLRDMAADVINEALGDEGLPLVRAVEELAHGERGGAVLADLAEVVDVFGREGVFEEEEVELLGLLGELYGLIRGIALVHVVEKADLFAELGATLFEELEAAAHGDERFEEGLVVERLVGGGCGSVRRAVSGHAGEADLDADVSEALLHVLAGVADGVRDLGAVRVGVGVDGFADLAAGELIDGHAGLAALDVPEGLVDSADRVVEYGTVLPIGAGVTGLPDVLDAVGGLAHEKGLEVLLDGRFDEVGALGEGGAAIPVETVLVGGDLDDREADARGGALDDADVFDAGSGESTGGAGELGCGHGIWSRQRDNPGCGDRFQQVPSNHEFFSLCVLGTV